MIKRKNMQKSWLMFMPLYCWSYFIQWWRRKGMRFWVIFMHFLWLNLFFNEEEDVMVLIKLTWCPPWIVFLPQRFVLKEFYAFSSEYQLVINLETLSDYFYLEKGARFACEFRKKLLNVFRILSRVAAIIKIHLSFNTI